jgi:hypothetical protein
MSANDIFTRQINGSNSIDDVAALLLLLLFETQSVKECRHW